ncbi:MAG: protein-L-isoaspartate(D-aspartate) O-methyltransferase [Rhodospirillales bacterium]
MNAAAAPDSEARREGMMRLVLAAREAGVTDARVLAAMEAAPRDVFVPGPFQSRAWHDAALPIGRHQTISQPSLVARMTEALDVTERMKVLEIGTGSGYQTCVLARLCRRVYTVERHASLQKDAEARLAGLGVLNITFKCGDGSEGWPEQAPFERILCTAAAVDPPPLLIEQLAEGGAMIAPVGFEDDVQSLMRFVKTGGNVEAEELGLVRFVPMIEGTAEE